MNLKLKAKIIEKCGTQIDFAQAIEMDDSFVSKIIRGRRILDTDKKLEWAEALDCNVKDIFD